MTPMEIRSKKKALFLALAVCMILSVVFTGVLAASILDHKCIGEENGCPYCLQIKAAKMFLKTLSIAFLVLVLDDSLLLPACRPQKISEFAPLIYSPVSLKVRFNT